MDVWRLYCFIFTNFWNNFGEEISCWILKLFLEFKSAGLFLFVSKKNVKKMKMLLMRLFFRWPMCPTPQMPVQAQKSHFVWIVEKSNIFRTKTLFFVEKQKEYLKANSDVEQSIRSCLTFRKYFLLKNCFSHGIIAFWNRLISLKNSEIIF